ncbi:response regulator [Domibacillus tundrae]|uniref:response regulator n=1 Tax=Domibacillus tundrae TaxID=1587527 RepID=UPI00061828CA|nr:response regulator [Domibacillus tundrae]
MAHILIVDDEQEISRFLTRLFQLKKMNVAYIDSGRAFDDLDRIDQFDAAFLDVRLPDRNGLNLLKELKKRAPSCKAVVMTGYSTVKTAVEAFIKKTLKETAGSREQAAEKLGISKRKIRYYLNET